MAQYSAPSTLLSIAVKVRTIFQPTQNASRGKGPSLINNHDGVWSSALICTFLGALTLPWKGGFPFNRPRHRGIEPHLGRIHSLQNHIMWQLSSLFESSGLRAQLWRCWYSYRYCIRCASLCFFVIPLSFILVPGR